LLFDMGDLGALAPNDLVKIEHVFISHTHMDHFIGFDHLLRSLLGRDKTLYLYGPKGFLDNVAGKMRAYTWNLVQNYAEALTVRVTEIDEDEVIQKTFDCRAGFMPSQPKITPREGNTIYRCPAFTVQTTILDHQIPCLAFSLQEQFHVNILKPQLDAMGLTVGPWLTSFKHLLFGNADPATEVDVTTADGDHLKRSYGLGELRDRIASITRGQKIVYVADALYSPDNEEKIVALARNADHLYIEAAFLESEADIARAKFHLTARQAGLLARKANAAQMSIFHHSPRYFGQAHLLETEARQAFEAR
ncbi:MAG: MBL fold metallo-hydrolase, partial [Desulfobacteraceae bacterium]|nr:MBL fold metallo-hydrolase [Desulfobacteraceae bacterium]